MPEERWKNFSAKPRDETDLDALNAELPEILLSDVR